MRIYLSPSDQTDNKYSAGNTTEGAVCKQIANACAKYLKENGYEVKVGDAGKGYVGRATESNQWPADLHIPIHTNAGGGDGTLVLVYPGYSNNKYAKAIYNSVATLTPGKDDGIKERTDLYEIVGTIAMCVYVEVEFHDNAVLAQWIINHIDDIARAIAKGVCDADGKAFKETASKPTNTGNSTLYKVQVGAFSIRENADALSDELSKQGFDNYVKKDGSYWKVQCGAFSIKSNALYLAQRLESFGYGTYIVEE